MSHPGVSHILRVDPAFAKIISSSEFKLEGYRGGDYFNSLLRAIIYQQLSTRAAESIYARFINLFVHEPYPFEVLSSNPLHLREVGLSQNKVHAVKDLALHALNGSLPLTEIDKFDDEEIIARLIKVRGIGRWTAEMFLIFQLERLDVWPVGDLAVRRGYSLIHSDKLPTPRELLLLGEVYRPFRTVAAFYCWRSSDVVV